MPSARAFLIKFDHDLRFLDSERRRRLVEDEKLRPEIDCACNCQSLPFSAGQRADQLLGID